VVMMLKGANAHKVIDDVQARMKVIQKSLPKGVTIEPYLNRSDLVGRAIHTVSKNLIEGAIIVILILVLLLGNFRAGLIVASVIPLSMLFAISLMNIFGVSGNLMSLGAIDFGLIVDGAVIIVESVAHRIYMSTHHLQGSGRLPQDEMDQHVFESSNRMMNSAIFGQIIILIVYLPIMALVGTEGKMFRPMAQVVTFALVGAALLSLTWVPMASSLFLSRSTGHKRNLSDRLMDRLHSIFNPVIDFTLKRRTLVTVSIFALFLLSLFVFTRLGEEFIPQLEEGDLAAGVMTLQGGSLTNTVETVEKANKILLDNFPEIKHAVCKIGSGEIPTDPTPMETGDYIITLKPKFEWTSAKTTEELVGKMEDKLAVLAGVKFEFQQPIQMRFNELISGSRQDIAVKIYGDDLNVLAEKAQEVETLIQNIKGVEDINTEKVTGLEQVQVEYNRDRLAQYGISVEEINRTLEAAFAGSQTGVVYDQDRRFGLVVRLDKDYRHDINDVRNLSVGMENGVQIPLYELADISVKSGPAQVSRENTKRRITVGFNVRNRDISGVIKDVSEKIDKQITLPSGYFIEYGGQFKNLEAAKARLSVAIPVALLLIFLLLYFAFRSVSQSLLILTTVPMSAIGGIFALWIRGMNFSVSAGVGFIALFGVAVLNGIVLIAEFNRLEEEGLSDIKERVRKGLHTRLRPVVITAAVASLGFLPMALSTSAGAEVQKPLATVVIGGLITTTLLTLMVLPVFYIFFNRQRDKFYARRKGQAVLKAVVVMLGLSAFPAILKAQDSDIIGLREAVKTAVENNPAVRSSEYNLRMQKALKGAAWDLDKTVIEGEYGQINSYTKDNSFTVSQSFAFPTVYIYQQKLAGANYEAGEWQLKQSQLGVATQVKQAYWQTIYLRSKERLLVYQDSLFTGIMKASEKKNAVGEAAKLEMITARSESMSIKNKLMQIRSDITVEERKLTTLVSPGRQLTFKDTVLARIGFLSKADSSAFMQNPSLGYLNSQVSASGYEKKVERSRLMPDFSVGYFSQSMRGTQQVNGADVTFGAGDRFTGIQAGISVPLWTTPYIAKAKAARYREQAVKADAERTAAELWTAYLSAVDDYIKYSGSIDYYEKQALQEADIIIQQASLSYKAGSLDYIDYVLTLNRALDIKQNYLDALNDYNQTIISIDYLTGKIL